MQLLRCPYSPRVQLNASTSVRTLKIQNTGSHTSVWSHENTAFTDRNGLILRSLIGMGCAAFAATVPYPGQTTRISRKGQRSNTYFLFTGQATGMYVRKVHVTRDTQLLLSLHEINTPFTSLGDFACAISH